MQDQIFNEKFDQIHPFQFDEKVAAVFDDMVSRSIPFYDEIHRIIVDIARKTHRDHDLVYDLGCSTGTTMAILANALNSSPRFIGIDNSRPMLDKCAEKLALLNIKDVELICSDLENVELQPAGMVIMNYTLQFIPVSRRAELLKKIYKSLRPGGVFIYSEKIDAGNDTIHELLTDLYYDFKRRNGYSELEIAQKREALENVLIPLTPEEQMDLLRAVGFKKSETVFRWYNFACFVGIK